MLEKKMLLNLNKILKYATNHYLNPKCKRNSSFINQLYIELGQRAGPAEYLNQEGNNLHYGHDLPPLAEIGLTYLSKSKWGQIPIYFAGPGEYISKGKIENSVRGRRKVKKFEGAEQFLLFGSSVFWICKNWRGWALPTSAQCSTGSAVLLKSIDGAWGLPLVTNLSQFEIQKEIPAMFFTFAQVIICEVIKS